MNITKRRLQRLAGLLKEGLEEEEPEEEILDEVDLEEIDLSDIEADASKEKEGEDPLDPEEFEIDEAIFSESGLDRENGVSSPKDWMDTDRKKNIRRFNQNFNGSRGRKRGGENEWDADDNYAYAADADFLWDMDDILDDNEANGSNLITDPSTLVKRTANFDAGEEGLSLRDRMNKTKTDPLVGSDSDYDNDNLGDVYGAEDEYADIEEPDAMRVKKDPFAIGLHDID